MNRDEFLRTLREALSGEIPPPLSSTEITRFPSRFQVTLMILPSPCLLPSPLKTAFSCRPCHST